LTDYESPSLYIHRYHGNFALAFPGSEPVLITSLAGLEYMIGRPVATSRIFTTGTYVVGRRPGARLDPAEEETYGLRETSTYFPTTIAALLAAVREDAPDGGAIGIDETGIKMSLWRELAAALDTYTLIEAAELFGEIRRIKSRDELALVREAARINEYAAGKAFALSSRGAAEMDMEAVFRAEAARLGADPVHWETTIGPRSSGSFYAGSYVGQPGDIIRSDSSVRYRMYWADTGRTRVIGVLRHDHQQTYDALLRGHLAMIEALRPGLCVGDLFAIGVDTVRKHGLPDYDRHHVGHSIGLEMYEPPILIARSDDRLEAGMVINVELPFYELGYVGLQIEDTLLITDSGSEFLTNADRSIVSILP
jgi:Xaa-Pro aminopeptidase